MFADFIKKYRDFFNWSFINLPWDMWSPKKKLGLIDSAVLTFIGYKQTNIQATNPSPFLSLIPIESLPLPFIPQSLFILHPSLSQSLFYPSPFPSSILIVYFPLPFLNPYTILHPSSIPILFFPRLFLNHYSILPPSPPQSLCYPSPIPYLIPIESLPLLSLPQSLTYPSSPFLNHYSILHPPLSSIPILSFTRSFLIPILTFPLPSLPYPSPFPSLIHILSFLLPFLNPYSILPPSLP